MDALYFLRHSKFDDIEIRYSLRGIHQNLPFIRKVWVFGDRPEFLSDDRTLVEHVPHEYVARVGHFRTPVTNFFLMFYLSSLITEMENEFLWFCDDFIVLEELSEADVKKARIVEDLGQVKNRGTGLWKESLWRTYDLLKRLGYTGWNFETHVPTFFTKKRVLEAYCEFRDYTTEDRWYGMLGPTAILNHAYKREKMDLVRVADEGRKIGFYGKPPSYEEAVEKCRGKAFLNFDDEGYGEGIRRYLEERFPEPCPYERAGGEGAQGSVTSGALPSSAMGPARSHYPRVIITSRDHFGELLNDLGLTGEGVEVGTLRGQFAASLLGSWRGRCLHCVDPWNEGSGDPRYVDINNVPQQVDERNYEEAKKQLSQYHGRHKFHRLTSREASGRFSDGTLDFVYLDARHYREAVEEDLNLWWPKVKSGGYLAGHDYLDGVLPSGHFEVKSAVDAWAAARGLEVTCSGEHVWRSWFIRKR